MRGIIARVSHKNYILTFVKHDFVDTSVLLRCYYAFVLPIVHSSNSSPMFSESSGIIMIIHNFKRFTGNVVTKLFYLSFVVSCLPVSHYFVGVSA